MFLQPIEHPFRTFPQGSADGFALVVSRLHHRPATFQKDIFSKGWFTALVIIVFLALLLGTGVHSYAQEKVDVRSESADQFDQIDWKNQRLKYKIVPLSNPVYQFLDYLETTGKIEYLPQAKPYTKIVIMELLDEVTKRYWLEGFEKELITNYISDFTRETNGFQLHKQGTKTAFAVVGFGAETTVRAGLGNNGTVGTSLIGTPFIAGDLGDHFSFNASIGGAIERLAPDLFYQSYTKDGKVNFPHESVGYASLPYQFTYETLYPHVVRQNNDWNIVPNVNGDVNLAMIYYTEMCGSWLDDAVQVNVNNQRRAWGHDEHNLVLSSTARRFPGVEIKLEPASWLRYSLLTGSLFSSESLLGDNKSSIYGEDKGLIENLFSLHLLEYTPAKWLQISATATTIWWKRLELSYLMPMVFSHFSQLEVGDYDNNAMSIDVAFKIPEVGKAWFSVFNDEFSFSKSGPLLIMPRNRYAWQAGLKTGYVSNLIPGTITTLKYTRITPFVYTHYPEERINLWNYRPLDMTYTHDGANLGFYLPPNSGELNLTFVNMAIPDVVFTLDNKLIMHGTNDLASTNQYQIYGDVYRDQTGDVYQYPYMNFTQDGIYDWTVSSDFKFDWKVRFGDWLDYFRVVGSAGFAGTWWSVNESGVQSPGSRMLFCGSLGVVVDM
jgi:hypothetical protein